MCMHIHINFHTCMLVRVCACVCTCTLVCVRVRANSKNDNRTYVHTASLTNTNTNTNTYKYIYKWHHYLSMRLKTSFLKIASDDWNICITAGKQSEKVIKYKIALINTKHHLIIGHTVLLAFFVSLS